MISISLFGAPRLIRDQQEIKVARRKSRALIFYLAAHDRPIRREQLLAVFWPDLPRVSAQQTLRTTLHGLRKVLGEAINIEEERVSLSQEVWCDAREFEQSLNISHREPELARRGLELYRGNFLEGFSLPDSQAYEDWIIIERERFQRLAIRGYATLAEHYEQAGNYQAALDYLSRALAYNPLQEDLQRARIRLYYLAGDRPAAIRSYDELRRLLDEEMGVPPMVETRALYDAIITDRLPMAVKKSVPALPPKESKKKAAIDLLPFTGREEELRAIQTTLADHQLALIEGEAGIGKTRLVQEYLRMQGVLALSGQGRELEQALPYHVIIDALQNLTSHDHGERIITWIASEISPIWQAEISRLLPELVNYLGETSIPLASAEEARLWEGLKQLLLCIARHEPVILFIDDAHWADASSLALLAYLVRQVGDRSIGFIATARTASQRIGSRSPWLVFVNSMLREEHLRRINLDRLALQDVREISRYINETYAEPFAGWLWKISEGNPYILAEAIRHARQNNILLTDGIVDLNALSTSQVVPNTVYSMIQARLESLSDEARRILDTAVAAGRDFEFEVVTQAAGLSETAALDALDELQAQGIISTKGDTHFTFNHGLTMEVAYHEIGEIRHRILHRRIAEALEHLYRDRLEQVAGQIAYHYAEGNDPQRGRRHALLAGQQAVRLAAWSEAIAFYEFALKGLAGVERIPILTALAAAQSKAGHFNQASDILREALMLAEARQDEDEINAIRLALARSFIPQARFDEVIMIAQQICGSAQPSSRMTAELLWGVTLSLEGHDLIGAEEHLQQALQLAQSSASVDLSALSQLHFELGNVQAQRGNIELAIAYYQKALEAALHSTQEDAVDQTILAYNNLAYHLHLLGDPEAITYAQKGLQLSEEKGGFGFQTYLYSTLGEIYLDQGELDMAEKYFLKGLSVAERFSIAERIAGISGNLGRLAEKRGQVTLAIHYLSQALGLADTLRTQHLSIQLRLWLAPLLPPKEAHQRLAEARHMAENSQRLLLLEQIQLLEKQLSVKD